MLASYRKKDESRIALVLKILRDDPAAQAACSAYIPLLTKKSVWVPQNYGGYLELTDGILRYGLAQEIITSDEFKLAQPYLPSLRDSGIANNRIAVQLLASTIGVGLSALTGANFLAVVAERKSKLPKHPKIDETREPDSAYRPRSAPR
jgi:hypothetical protein